MKALFYGILYMSLGISALLFSAWTVVYFPFFDRSVVAKEVVNSDASKEKKNAVAPKSSGVLKAEPSSSGEAKVQTAPGAGGVQVEGEKVVPQGSSVGVLKKAEDKSPKAKPSSSGEVKVQTAPGARGVPVKGEKVQQGSSVGVLKKAEDKSPKAKPPSSGEAKVQTGPGTGGVPVKGEKVVPQGSSVGEVKREPSSTEIKEGDKERESATNTVNSSEKKDIQDSTNNKPVTSEEVKNNSTQQTDSNNNDVSSLMSSGLKNEVKSKVSEIYQILSEYQYDAESPQRPNPFAPYRDASEEVDPVDKQIPLTPAEMYELSDMKLIGIKWGSKVATSKALFRSPDRVVHVLQKHDRIGSNRGIIYQLREDEVVVLNPRIDVDKNTYEPIVITLDRSQTIESDKTPMAPKKTGS